MGVASLPKADNPGMARIKPGVFAGRVSGLIGGAVYVVTADGGTFVREPPRPNDPRTSAQLDRRADFQKAVRFYANLTAAEQDAWRAWAAAQGQGGRPVRGVNAFVALATVFLRLNPSSWPPRLPPSSVFLGDGVVVRAEPGPGGVTFVADRPNSPGVATALMLQRLRSHGESREPGKARVREVVSFSPGGLSVTVPARRGEYEAAVKLYEASTGQSTALAWLGRVDLEQEGLGPGGLSGG
jgi:hypothetical protein